MKRLLTIVGARPQIIKASAISRAIRDHHSHELEEILVHTGQHYDKEMSDVFFEELEIPEVKHHLGIGSGSHAEQTGRMMMAIDEVIDREAPNAILLYGDTNSTLAASVTAIKKHVPVIHVEAGVRAFKKRNPEEVNRFITDHMSGLLFVPTQEGMENLEHEGVSTENQDPPSADRPWVRHYEDIMLDNTRYVLSKNEERNIKKEYGIESEAYWVGAIHRPFNTDEGENLLQIFRAFHQLTEEFEHDIVIPLHPRTRKKLDEKEGAEWRTILENPRVRIMKPASFTDMSLLLQGCEAVFTDSGGVQKEAFFLQKPCLVLNEVTPWNLLLQQGTNILTYSDTDRIVEGYRDLMDRKDELEFPPLFGQGNGAPFMLKEILAFLKAQ